MTESAPLIMTIGHANRSLEDMLALLTANAVRRVVDIRATPRSRYHPQFNVELFGEALRRHGIHYEHAPRLADARMPQPDSINTAWHDAARRGYADYMQTGEFAIGLERLLSRARRERVVIMCAEAAMHGHCLLISDALVARGAAVEHILSKTRRVPHVMSEFAVITDGRVSYPGPASAD